VGYGLADAAATRRHAKTKTKSGSKAKTKSTAAPKPPAPKAVGAAGLIAVARHQLESGNLAAAASYAASASTRAPILDDYAQYVRAQAEYGLKNYPEVAKASTRVFDHVPLSPFAGPAAALAVRAELDNSNPQQALALVKKHYDRIPDPQADLLLARCLDATGDLAQAAESYKRVYYNYPTSKEATDAANALVDLKNRMGSSYPAITPHQMLGRAQKLFESSNGAAARIELAAAIPQLTGAPRDLARVRLGVADYLDNHAQAAFEYLSALKVDDPEADAERLDYLIRCARKLDKHADVKPFLNQLEQRHPQSPWRLEALIAVADQARVDNDPATYLPLYGACAATFPNDPKAAWCHWRIAFDSYRHDSSDAYDLLRTHIQKYPASNDVNDALYFFGRLAQRKHQNGVARACYDEVISRFPNTYFSIVAHERLKDPDIESAVPDSATTEFLHAIVWPAPPEFPSFTPAKTAEARMERAQLLQLTGLTDYAEGELRFAASNDEGQQNLYAFELAKLAASRDSAETAMRYIKHYAPGYLYMPLDQAPVAFWKLAFPIPYRSSIESRSRQEGLDPYLVAALIRQESEFNATVISHANAYGLMQVLPSTGRDLARHFRVRRYHSSQLLTADRNIQFGTYYFRNLLNSFDGRADLALASYNAGAGRARLWQTWGPYREPAEFVETVPFHETRGYIQIVLRNADVYRRLYAGSVPDVPRYQPKPAPKLRPRKTLHPSPARSKRTVKKQTHPVRS
jgi:soluble lytic murein transglycosylase